MKTTTTKSKTSLTVLGLMIMLLTSVISGQQNETKSEQHEQRMIGNLITGINSENDGLRRSCIYFAGKYKVEETVDALVDQLEKESSTDNKYLISLSLYLIGNDKGIEAVKRVAAFDKDPRAKRLAAAVYFECMHNESDILASTENGK